MSPEASCIAVVVAAGETPALQRVAGRSLLARAVATAAAARRVGRVTVIADAPAVLDEAARAGAEALAASDLAAAGDTAVLDVLPSVAGNSDIAVVIDPAAALITPDDVDAAIAVVHEGGADCAVAATPVRHALRQAASGPPMALTAGPDAAILADEGAIRAVRVGRWREAGTRTFGVVAPVPLPPERALRADTPEALRAVAAIVEASSDAARGLERLPARPAGLIMDFDGVFTDNRVLVDQDGREAVLCNRSDGMGLEQLRARGLPMLVLSKERNPVVSARCAKLKLECRQAVDDKGPALLDWCREQGLDPAEVVYIGNDTNDLPCFALVGCAVAVADSHPEALAAADVVLRKNGGFGAVRDLTDRLALRLDSAG